MWSKVIDCESWIYVVRNAQHIVHPIVRNNPVKTHKGHHSVVVPTPANH